MKPLRALVLVLFWGLSSQAQILNLTTTQESQLSQLTIATEFTQLSVEEETIAGNGGKVSYQRSFSEHLGSEIFISSTLNVEGGVRPGTTTLGFYGLYNVFNNFSGIQKIQLNGQTLIQDRYAPTQQLKLGAGIEQVFLSGSRGVYSAAGPGLQLIYERNLFSWRGYVGVRNTLLQTNDLKINGLTFNLGLVFDL